MKQITIQVLGYDARGWFYHTGETYDRNVRITRAEYDAILAEVKRQWTPRREHRHAGKVTIHFDPPFVYQPAPVGAGGTNSKRVVLVHHANGATETDAQFWERQEDLADYAATVDAASYWSQ